MLAATEAKVPARSLWVCQTISTRGEFADLASSNANPMLSLVGMEEPPDKPANAPLGVSTVSVRRGRLFLARSGIV
jgi:hypothetical protein